MLSISWLRSAIGWQQCLRLNAHAVVEDNKKVATLFAVVDDVLAEQVIVAEHHRGAQCGEMLLHPHHLLLQHHLAGNLLLDSVQKAQTQIER